MLRKILANFSARFSVAIINFLVLLLTTNFLGSETRGEVSVIALGLSIVHLLSDIAGGPSLVYLVPRASSFTLLILGYAWSLCCVTLIGIPLVYLNLIPQEFGRDILILSLLVSLHSVHLNLLLGKEQIRRYNLLLILQALVLIGSMSVLIFIFKGKDTQVYITGAYIAYSIVLLASTFLVWRELKGQRFEHSVKTLTLLFRNGFFTQVANLTHQLSTRVNFYLLGAIPVFVFSGNFRMNSEQAVGVYSTAIALAEAILLFSQSVATVVLSRTANTSDPDRTRRIALQASKLSFAITIPGMLLFILLPASFYTALLGKDFLPVKHVFLPLAPGIAFISFGTVYSHYFSGMGKHFMNAMSGSIALVVTLVSAWWLIPRYGLPGASLSATLAYCSMSFFIFLMFVFEKGTSFRETMQHFFSRADWELLKGQLRKLLGR